MSERRESLGRIEVAPDVLTMIAHAAATDVEGVWRVGPAPSDAGRLFRRGARADGVMLTMQDGRLTFDIYVLIAPHVNIVETSRALQSAVIEAIDKLVGAPVDAVNVHVEDVHFGDSEAV